MPNLIASASDSFIPRLRSKFHANMADKVKGDILRLRRLCLSNTILANRKRQLIMQMAVHHLLARRRRLLYVCSLIMLLLSQRNAIARVPRRRSCRRLIRNEGWWHEPHILSSTAAILLSYTPRFLPVSFLCACHVA